MANAVRRRAIGSGQERVDFLVATYRAYRQRLHRLSLDGTKNLVGDDEFVAERRGVVEIWEEVMREALR